MTDPRRGMAARMPTMRSRAPDEVKALGRRVARGVGRATAPARMLPAFLVVGAQRAGTTSLHRALMAHPDVVPPLFHKGIHYFDVAYGRGMRWYRGHFPVTAVARRRVAGLPQTFESSGYYMHHPLAIERIAADLPDVRLVVMLRDPVERAYSAHRHECARGFDHLPFEEALDREPERLVGEVARMRADPSYVSVSHRHHSYVDRGQYAGQLVRMFDAVGRDRVHVLGSEDFFERPEEEFARLLDFLGLTRWQPDGFERWNARPRAPMAAATRARLEAHFAPHDDALARLLGYEPSWRR
ncbi:sulfotransferase [Euzebya sp.]|uniref:sulfotransferase family protein n=1 Tax=Euzebya sp. TaxID=1971409 RepID=UPI003517179C